jgi:Ser/Thr protein kinase RdoA (MazF antagonist)
LKKMLRGLVLIGALAGVAVAVRNYVSKSAVSGEEVVQITFDDNTSQALAANSVEGQEFTDIARKLVEIGV